MAMAVVRMTLILMLFSCIITLPFTMREREKKKRDRNSEWLKQTNVRTLNMLMYTLERCIGRSKVKLRGHLQSPGNFNDERLYKTVTQKHGTTQHGSTAPRSTAVTGVLSVKLIRASAVFLWFCSCFNSRMYRIIISNSNICLRLCLCLSLFLFFFFLSLSFSLFLFRFIFLLFSLHLYHKLLPLTLKLWLHKKTKY